MLHGQNSKRSQPEWQPSTNEGYVYLQGYVLIPNGLMTLISEHGVRIDYDYKDGTKHWKLHDNPKISAEHWSHGQVIALKILNKLEK